MIIYLFIVIKCFLVLIISIYLYYKGKRILPDQFNFKKIYKIAFWIAIVAIFILLIFDNILSEFISENYKNKANLVNRFLGYCYFSLLVYTLTAIFSDLIRVLNYYFNFSSLALILNNQKVKLIWFILALIFPLIIISFFNSKNKDPRVVEFEVDFTKVKNELSNLTIVAAGDLHIGNLTDFEELNTWVNLINRQNPDVILLLGDIYDWSLEPRISIIANQSLIRLKSKYGVYAVQGNHEHYLSKNGKDTLFKESGISFLRDQYVIINNSIVIIGREDASLNTRKELHILKNDLSKLYPIIVMDHQPVEIETSVQNKIAVLLCGHTHNGQIFPMNLIYSLNWELIYGFFINKSTHIFITAGLGYRIIPIRIGTKSEILKIKLK